jgi:hypothetical protein
VTTNNLALVGDTEASRDTTADGAGADDVIVGNLDRIDSILLFRDIWLTDESITSAGTEYVLDTAADTLDDDDGMLFVTNASGLDFSRVTTTGVTASVYGGDAARLTGSAQADTLTGGWGADVITGAGGNDVLNGGTAAEVRSFELSGVFVADGNFASFDFMGQGNLTLSEAAVADTNYADGAGAVIDGAGTVAVGTALAALLNANRAQATSDFQAATGSTATIASVSFNSATRELLFTFDFAEDVDNTDVLSLGYAAGGDGGTFAVSASSVLSEGGSGGADTFVFEASAAANGLDRIDGFTAGAVDDVLDFTAFLGQAAVGLTAPYTTASNGNANISNWVARFDANGTALSPSGIANEFAAGQAFAITAGEQIVVLEIDSSTSGEDARVWFVHDANGNGSITAGEVTLVGLLSEAGDQAFTGDNVA